MANNLLKNIILDAGKIKFGFAYEGESEICLHSEVIIELSTDQQNIINDFNTMIGSRVTRDIERIVSQITADQHMSEERSIVKIIDEEDIVIINISSLDSNDITRYSNYTTLAQSIINAKER